MKLQKAENAANQTLTLKPKSIEARYLRGLSRLQQGLLIVAKKSVLSHLTTSTCYPTLWRDIICVGVDLEIVIAHQESHTNADEALQSVNIAWATLSSHLWDS